jgi:hypothetical protein
VSRERDRSASHNVSPSDKAENKNGSKDLIKFNYVTEVSALIKHAEMAS